MTQFFAKAALAALIGLGGLGAISAPASAAGLEFGIYDGGGLSVQYGERQHRRDRHEQRGGWGRDGRCAPWMAEGKARERFGLRRAQVVDVTPRRVVVEGRRHGRFVSITFANARGCPALGNY